MKTIHRRHFLGLAGGGTLAAALTGAAPVSALVLEPGQARVKIDLQKRIGLISPGIYGQFIEHLGRCIQGGIFEEGSPLSDSNGFRRDVLEKVKRLAPPLLRYPGGTVTKIYHWRDGVGPKNKRPRRRNLIWGGEEDNRFGTDEFIRYCRIIGAEPFLVTNMATGTAEEAANWVEYCNGTGNTEFANLRRAHGFAEPHNVKYWGLGNEEHGEPDVGRLQEPEAYVKEAWQFAKLMKLQDPGVQLILSGHDENWNRKILRELHPVCDFLSLHFYARPTNSSYASLFANIAGFEQTLRQTKSLLLTVPEQVREFSPWYRFQPRRHPVRLAIDEWGIWESGKTAHELELKYSWTHALATATLLNIFQRHADVIGLATWAQMVNVLAPIFTSQKDSTCQPVFYPLELYRRYCGKWSLEVQAESDRLDSSSPHSPAALDVAASYDDEKHVLTLAVVNRDAEKSFHTALEVVGRAAPVMRAAYQLSGPPSQSCDLIEPSNDRVSPNSSSGSACTFPPHSMTLLLYGL